MEKEFENIQVSTLLEFVDEVSKHDTRIDRCKVHSARTIVFITFVAILCGYKNWDDIACFGSVRKSFFEEYLGKLDSVPSEDTIRRFFAMVRPESFEGVYRTWLSDVFRLRRSGKSGESIVAIDGKELRSASSADGSPLRIVSAYAVEDGLSLGQVCVTEKSNEIPAAQQLVEELDISGCIITADAMHCQKKTVEAIVRGKGDYFIFVKGNQEKLRSQIGLCVQEARRHRRQNNDYAEAVEHEHRKKAVTRTCIAVGEQLYLGDMRLEWAGIRSFGVVRSLRYENGRPVTEERAFISSLAMDARRFIDISRMHWGIENGLHWRLDAIFDEDSSRKKRNAEKNVSLLRKLALAMLSMDDTIKKTKKKQMMATLDDGYLHKLLNMCDVNL